VLHTLLRTRLETLRLGRVKVRSLGGIFVVLCGHKTNAKPRDTSVACVALVKEGEFWLAAIVFAL
jgi:hypothetical protein